MKKIKLPIIAAALLLSGCVTSQSVPLPSASIANSNKARIEIVRGSSMVGGARNPAVMDGDLYIGDIGRNGELVWDRPAGNACITAETFHLREICFTAIKGKTSTIRYSVGYGFAAKDLPNLAINNNKK